MTNPTTHASPSVVEPDLPVIDSHHHLWLMSTGRYLLDEFVADVSSGHRVLATVYAECSAMYRRRGPERFRSVGEAEFVAGCAAMSESRLFGPTQICAAFIGAADFTLGAQVDEVLEALAIASGGRLRGIRGAVDWDGDASLSSPVRPFAPPLLLLDPQFREGVARLAARKLVYDAWQYYPQLAELCSLADAFPDLPIVVNHCGGLLGIGAYAAAENFTRWRASVADVARRPNTFMKLSGLAPRRCGFGFAERAEPPSAGELAALWRPYVETCIDLFGPERCMFASNFPVDGVAGSYLSVWNALKLTAANFSAIEKHTLFCGTASRVYGIETDASTA